MYFKRSIMRIETRVMQFFHALHISNRRGLVAFVGVAKSIEHSTIQRGDRGVWHT
jgi:hypothetical protein